MARAKLDNLQWTPDQVRLGDLIPWEDNPRRLSRAAARRLLRSWQEFGQVHAVAVGPDNEIYDGHQRLRVLMDAYGPDHMVDVRRSNRPLTDAERRALVLALHTGAAGQWDWDRLADWDVDLLAEWGIGREYLDDLYRERGYVADLIREASQAQLDTTEDGPLRDHPADALVDKWGVKREQIWSIGPHWVACMDSTDPNAHDAVVHGSKSSLIFTDPPYGVAIGSKNMSLDEIARAGRVVHDIDGDADVASATQIIADAMIHVTAYASGAIMVCAPSGTFVAEIINSLEVAGVDARHIIVWDKINPTFSMGRLHYPYTHEFIIYGYVAGHEPPMMGEHRHSIWRIERPRKNRWHPTSKPIELVANAIMNHTREDDLVVDPFLGSGTTILAAHRTGRVGAGIEIDPRYVAVTLERMAQEGLEPELIHAP